jgi:hypothetical protein
MRVIVERVSLATPVSCVMAKFQVTLATKTTTYIKRSVEAFLCILYISVLVDDHVASAIL